jgi:hypothetical protein
MQKMVMMPSPSFNTIIVRNRPPTASTAITKVVIEPSKQPEIPLVTHKIEVMNEVAQDIVPSVITPMNAVIPPLSSQT